MLNQNKIIQQKMKMENSIKVIDKCLENNLKIKSSIDTKLLTISNIDNDKKEEIEDFTTNTINTMKLQSYILNDLKHDLDKLLAYNLLNDKEQELMMTLKLREKVKTLKEYNTNKINLDWRNICSQN